MVGKRLDRTKLGLSDLKSFSTQDDGPSQRTALRGRHDAPVEKYYAVAAELNNMGHWTVKFALAGQHLDYARAPNGKILEYPTEERAKQAGYEAIVGILNASLVKLQNTSNSRFGIGRDSSGKDIRPAKMKAEEFVRIQNKTRLGDDTLRRLFNKRGDRIAQWKTVGDIPHEIALLMRIFEELDAAIDVAHDFTEEMENAALSKAP